MTCEYGRRANLKLSQPTDDIGESCMKAILGSYLLCLCVTAVGCRAPAYQAGCFPPPVGLVSWWPGEGSGADLYGHNDGILRNGAKCAQGKVGRAFDLDGTSQYVYVPDSASLNPDRSITVEAWICPHL